MDSLPIELVTLIGLTDIHAWRALLVYKRFAVHTLLKSTQALAQDNFTKIVSEEGCTVYRLNGRLHRRDDLPAIDSPTFSAWYYCGLLHREDGPAEICTTKIEMNPRRDTIETNKLSYLSTHPYIVRSLSVWPAQTVSEILIWSKQGKLHRKNGPAVEITTTNAHYHLWFRDGVPYRSHGAPHIQTNYPNWGNELAWLKLTLITHKCIGRRGKIEPALVAHKGNSPAYIGPQNTNWARSGIPCNLFGPSSITSAFLIYHTSYRMPEVPLTVDRCKCADITCDFVLHREHDLPALVATHVPWIEPSMFSESIKIQKRYVRFLEDLAAHVRAPNDNSDVALLWARHGNRRRESGPYLIRDDGTFVYDGYDEEAKLPVKPLRYKISKPISHYPKED